MHRIDARNGFEEGGWEARPRPAMSTAHARADHCQQALPALLRHDDAEAEQLRTETRAARQSAAELSALLTLKAPPLQRRSSRLSSEVDGLAAETARLVAATEQCLDELRSREEALRAYVAEKRADAVKQAAAVQQRRTVLLSEVGALEARMSASETVAESGCLNGPTFAASMAARRAELVARIRKAKARQAEAAEKSAAATVRAETKLSKLREEHARHQATMAERPRNWKGRFEAFINEQRSQAEHLASSVEDETSLRLSQALDAVNASLQEADCASPPKLVAGAVRLVQGLAAAERRRMALLRTRWQELQRHQQISWNS
eukprot:TRINITY_DN102255_c0_g1_i1.p1 TRINITY_DN102255_c0_g1~~TRINITY_DN102255_c0_g1_i1.p1  ORF type:complete len:321 (+),score=81.59 TRINITY_DN102255_c0_g1_i1:130-1092(+)